MDLLGVEEVEKTVFSGAAAPTERIYLLRREATEFYRAVHPLLGPLEEHALTAPPTRAPRTTQKPARLPKTRIPTAPPRRST